MDLKKYSEYVPKQNIFNRDNVQINDENYRKLAEERQMKEQEKEAQRMGLDLQKVTKKYDTVEDLVKQVPGMVTAQVAVSSTMHMKDRKMRLEKGEVYVMSYGTYSMSHKDKLRGSVILKPHNKHFRKLFKRYRGQDLNRKKLLVWRSGGIGDIMFSQPVIKYLRDKYPDCKITYATASHNASIFDCWPKHLVNKVLYIPFKKEELIRSDYHLTFEGSIERCKEAEEVNCYDIFRKVAGLDFNPSDYPIELIPKTEVVDQVKCYIPDNTVMIHMRASAALRMMPSENWKGIVDGLEDMGYTVAVIDSPKMNSVYESFKTEQDTPNLINLCKYSTSLNEGIAMLSQCKGFIGIDSSFTHLAAGLNVPAIGIYGPFLGKVRMQYYKNADWVDSTDYDECGMYPCFYHQHDIKKCPFIQINSLPGCLGAIKSSTVLDKFQSLMEKQ